MQVTETKNEGLTREFAIVVPAAEIESRMASKLAELAEQVRIPGFRPGKVPAKLLRQRYGQAVLGDVIQNTVVETSSQAITERDITPATQPKIDVTSFDDGKDLEYTMAVEVMPEINPVDFKTLSLERLSCAVNEEEIDKAVKNIASEMVRSEPIAEAREARNEDIVVIDFVGSVDGVEFEGGKASDFQLTLGSGRFIPGFEDQLVGAKPGDHVTVKVKFPDEYPAENLRGKDASFEVDVKEIRERVETPIDDELAKSLGLESLQQLRDGTKEQIDRDYRMVARNRLKRDLLDRLDDAHDFEIPPGMVEAETQSIMEQLEQARQSDSVDDEDKEKSEEELREQYGKIARRRVRLGLLLAEVGRKNNIEVTAEELNRAMLNEVRRYPGQERQVMEYFQRNPQATAGLRAPIFEDKVIDFILEMADVTDREVSSEELLAPVEAEAESTSEAVEKKKPPAKKPSRKKSAAKGAAKDTDAESGADSSGS